MELIFLGTGNAFSESGDRPSCYVLQTDDSNILIDCGPSVLPALYQNNIKPKDLSGIYISHLHPDHYFGLAFLFLDNYYISKREKKLPVFAPPGIEEKVLPILKQMYSPKEVATIIDCYEFIEVDNNSTIPFFEGMLTTLPSLHHGNARMAIFDFDDFSIGYSGDTEYYPESFNKMVEQCDLIIHEVTSAEFKIEGHTNLFDIVDLKLPEDVHLYISHHDQSVIDALEHVQLPSNFHVARDNDRVDIRVLLQEEYTYEMSEEFSEESNFETEFN